MPSGHLERLDQQRARREAEKQKNPFNSPASLLRRKKELAQRHKSRVAEKLKAAIMCDSLSTRSHLDATIRATLRKFSSLVNYSFRKCTPTFVGMPSLFDDMQRRHPQEPMRKLRRKGQEVSLRISHVQNSHSAAVKFCRISGFDSSFRKSWPNYTRSPFTLACAFDRSEIVRTLVVDFECDLGESNIEDGLVLIDENKHEREWHMTGFDLTVEFGCLATFDLLCALEGAHPHVVAAVEYAGIEHEDCRVLCMRNARNKLTSCGDPMQAIVSLKLYTDDSHDCECAFCSGY